MIISVQRTMLKPNYIRVECIIYLFIIFKNDDVFFNNIQHEYFIQRRINT